jgi:hypothetical protein
VPNTGDPLNGISYDSVLVGIYQQVVGRNPPLVKNSTINNTLLPVIVESAELATVV